MNDRLGQGARSEEPSDEALRAQAEWERERKAKLAELRHNLFKLERAARRGESLGDRADDLARPLWDHIEREAA